MSHLQPVFVIAFASQLALAVCCSAQMPTNYQLESDWHVDEHPFLAQVIVNEENGTITLTNGLISRTIDQRLGATTRFANLMTGQSIIRAVEPESEITIDGEAIAVGGAEGQPNKAFLTEEWLAALKTLPQSMELTAHEIGEPTERLAWKRTRHHSPQSMWPPRGKTIRLDYAIRANDPRASQLSAIKVSVHYEIYDGIPLLSKWITVHNLGDKKVTVDRFVAERLSVVEHSSPVETREGVSLP